MIRLGWRERAWLWVAGALPGRWQGGPFWRWLVLRAAAPAVADLKRRSALRAEVAGQRENLGDGDKGACAGSGM